MQIIDTELADVKIIALKKYEDERGFFCERFRSGQWYALGLGRDLIQQNHSRSHPRVLRGLHAQHSPAQGKLVGVISGRILDVAVDIRPHSPTFKQHVAVELSADDGRMLWVPGGFAHGFCVLGDASADVLYGVDEYYNAANEIGIRFDDASLGISWPVASPLVSPRDAALPSLSEITPLLKKIFAP
jgi:dTDP-4-dehydrorhamnose 3,5-epimerase